MRVKIILFSVVTALLLATPAYANLPRMLAITPSLSFTDTTANCSVTISGASNNAKISAVISLKNGNNCVESWEESAVGYFYFSDTVLVTRGKSYILSEDATIDGKTYPTSSSSNTCE